MEPRPGLDPNGVEQLPIQIPVSPYATSQRIPSTTRSHHQQGSRIERPPLGAFRGTRLPRALPASTQVPPLMLPCSTHDGQPAATSRSSVGVLPVDSEVDTPQLSQMHEKDDVGWLLKYRVLSAHAQEESMKILNTQFAKRDAKKGALQRERQIHSLRLAASQRDREERWSRKLQRSPFAVDLVAENQRIDEENRVRDHVEQRRQRLAAKRSREIHDFIFKQAATHPSEIHQLRTEKRLLLENERQLKASRDVERHNARTAQILQERRQQQLQQQKERQQKEQEKEEPLPQAIHVGNIEDWRIRTS
mmetsp:Transcript_54262/g.108064  ORF Transcript_54262/g.108064 Transcript_54262/m.108064 type:complete len:306 (-) Transcript_54262:29-946(-)